MPTREEIVHILTEVLALLRRGWTQHAEARDASGAAIDDGTHPNAVAWCPTGALVKLASLQITPIANAIANANGHRNFVEFVKWQDEANRTSAEVRKAIQRTIDQVTTCSDEELEQLLVERRELSP